MKNCLVGVLWILGIITACERARAQIVINELVDDERTASAGQVAIDTREFVELYNAGGSDVDLSGWTITTLQIGSNFGLPAGTQTYTLPGGSMIPADGYFVIKAPAVTIPGGVGFFEPTFPAGKDLFPDGANSTNGNYVMELRDSSSTLIDAIANETFRGTERENLTAEQLGQAGGGWWGQDPSFNVTSPNQQFSLSRYLNGRDTNVNGRDFGMLPLTPGASNNLPQNVMHSIPNVDNLGLEEPVTDYYASFIMPRAIDPTNADGNFINPTSISASPQGGKAIIAYDESGGGNSTYSKELVQKFDLYAYIETAPINLVDATNTQRSEASVFGIGTTDGLFGTPNGAGLLTNTSTQNSSTGYGWMIQRVENYNDGSPTNQVVLMLIDFGDGGDSLPEDHEWNIMQMIDLTGTSSDWHRLSIEYDPATGVVTAKHGLSTGPLETTAFTIAGDYNDDSKVDAADYVVWRDNDGTSNDLPNNGIDGDVGVAHYELWKANFGNTATTNALGTFYVGYRENLGGNLITARPPTFDMIGSPSAALLAGTVPEPNSSALVALGIAVVGLFRSRR